MRYSRTRSRDVERSRVIPPPPGAAWRDRAATRRATTGYTPASDAAQREQAERRPRRARLEEEEVDALGQPGKAREDRVEVARGHEAEREAERRGDEHERRRLEHDLRDDAPAPHADRAHDGDLADALVHRHGDERRDEQEADDEAHGAEDDGELAEVAEPLVDLLRAPRRGDHGDARQLRARARRARARRRRRRAAAPWRATRGRPTPGPFIARSVRERQRGGALVEREVDEPHASDDAQHALARRARAAAGRSPRRRAPCRRRCAPSAREQSRRSRRSRRARRDRVRRRARSRPAPPASTPSAAAVTVAVADAGSAAGRRAPGSPRATRAARGAARRGCRPTRIVASVSNGSVPLGETRSWKPCDEQQVAERLAHPGGEHDHVEQHRRRDGDAEDGEQRCARGAGRSDAKARVSDHRVSDRTARAAACARAAAPRASRRRCRARARARRRGGRCRP